VAERSPTAGKKGRAKLEFIESDLPNSRKQFTVTLPANVVKKYFDLAVNEFRETSQPSGFRKGSKVRTNRKIYALLHRPIEAASNDCVD
jgi:hypothetical protein